jgi:cobalt-zinc-cadmium efflux system membrane fusion protein
VVETGSASLKTLPETAVVDFEGKPYVFRQDSPVANGETKFTMLPILKGADSEGFVEVTIPGQAHAANQLYVVKGAYALLGKLKNAGEEE